jgi:hypothetical protein
MVTGVVLGCQGGPVMLTLGWHARGLAVRPCEQPGLGNLNTLPTAP